MEQTIFNTTPEDLRLLTGHLIPANGKLAVEPQVITRALKEPLSARYFRDGLLEVGRPESKEPPAAVTRETIATMAKRGLKEYLEAHGAATDGTIDDLRARLADVMFVDL